MSWLEDHIIEFRIKKILILGRTTISAGNNTCNYNPQMAYPDLRFLQLIPWFRFHYVFSGLSFCRAREDS